MAISFLTKWEVESFIFSCDFKHKMQQRLKSAHKKMILYLLENALTE